jgi:hypothetical protein
MGFGFRRRRPLMRAAMLAGAGTLAYQAGKRRQADESADYTHEYEQDQAIAGAYQPQAPPPAPATVHAGGGTVAQLERLKALLDQGALTQQEFDAAKQQVLNG